MAANRESSRQNGYGNGSALKQAEEEIVKGKVVFSELCPACEKYLKQLERELSRLRHSSPNDAQVVTKLSQLIVQFTKETNQLSANLDQFEEQQWNLHGGNMHMEFSKVALETFREATNWGRVLMFFGFAVSFSVYLEQGRVVGASDSVLEWTCQLVEEELAEFFSSHGGWEGFGDYLDTALKATHRSRTNQRNIVGDGEVPADEDSRASLWFAAGAMAVGAMAAFTLKQAFS